MRPNVASGSFSENFRPAWGLPLGLSKHCDYILLPLTVYHNYLNACLSPLLVSCFQRSWTVSLVHYSTARAHHAVWPLCIFSEWISYLLEVLTSWVLCWSSNYIFYVCHMIVWFSLDSLVFPSFSYDFLCSIWYILSKHWPPPQAKFLLYSSTNCISGKKVGIAYCNLLRSSAAGGSILEGTVWGESIFGCLAYSGSAWKKWKC